MTRRALAALALALLGACGGASPQKSAEEAQVALSKGNYAEAQQLAERGLKAEGATKSDSWTLERLRLEAIAAQGKSADVTAGLAKLTASYPDKVNAELYAKLGLGLADAGKGVESLELVEAGKKKFPDKATAFDGLVENLKARAAAGDDALTAQLRQLGYL